MTHAFYVYIKFTTSCSQYCIVQILLFFKFYYSPTSEGVLLKGEPIHHIMQPNQVLPHDQHAMVTRNSVYLAASSQHKFSTFQAYKLLSTIPSSTFSSEGVLPMGEVQCVMQPERSRPHDPCPVRPHEVRALHEGGSWEHRLLGRRTSSYGQDVLRPP